MKTLKIILSFAVLFSFSSCKKKLTQFYIDYNTSVVLQSSAGTLIPISLSTPDVETNSTTEFENNDTRADRIRSILLKELTLTITSPANETFSFLSSVEVYISSPYNSEQRIAFKENIPNTVGNTITCDLIDMDLKDFIKEKTFKIRIKYITDETTTQDVSINIYSNFLVDAKIRK